MPNIPHPSIPPPIPFSLSTLNPFPNPTPFSLFLFPFSMANSTNGAEVTEVPVTKTVTFTSLKPQLFVEAPKANDAVQFFKAAFGAEEVNRDANTKRKADQEMPLLVSVELKIGSFSFLVSDLTDDVAASVKGVGTGSVICLETEDVEAAVAKAVTAGAISEGETTADGEGACCEGGVGKVKDPYGNLWMICSPIKQARALLV